MRVLIAEDDPSVSSALASALERNGHSTSRVSRGSDVLLTHGDFDVLMLDLGLEDGDGFEVIHQLRRVTDIPIIVVTARGDERSTVRALRLGADDFLVKPVRLQELLARLDVAGKRRRQGTNSDKIVSVGPLDIDLAAHRVTHAGSETPLTPTEFSLLAVLAQRPGSAVSREQVLDEVWGDAFAARSRTLDVHLAQLRQKLPTDVVITTIRGFGFRLEA